MAKYLLVDANNIMFAAQHHSRKLTCGGHETTAIFGFMNSLHTMQQRYPGSNILVLWDGSPSWRASVYPDYKGNRNDPKLLKVKEALSLQRPRLKAGIRDMGLAQFTVQGMEADDLAAFFADMIAGRGDEAILITSDEDWIQLVRPGVRWYAHREGKSVTYDTFFEDTGFDTPEKFLEAKIMQGDSSDNIPGIGGLGEGAAKLILAEFDNLWALYTKWAEFRPTIIKGSPWRRYEKKIQAFFDDPDGWGRYGFNKRLVRLDPTIVPKHQLKTDSAHDRKAFAQFLGVNGFISIHRRLDEWLAPFKLIHKHKEVSNGQERQRSSVNG
jgi:5'-3' exonuclease